MRIALMVVMLCGAIMSSQAHAQSAAVGTMSISDARRALREAMLQQQYSKHSGIKITESGIEISFGATVVQFPFRDTPDPKIETSGSPLFSTWRGFRVIIVGKDLVGKSSEEQKSCCYWAAEKKLVVERFVAAFKVHASGVPADTVEEAEAFKVIADQYLVARPKLEFPEKARRERVQAESALRDKRLDDAIDHYEEALKIAPWWPEGRFNRALVLGELGWYTEAVREMKRYLVLMPDAPNARAAQDRIYEWEGRAGR